MTCDEGIVGYHDDGLAKFAVQILEEFHDFGPGFAVQRAGRFIGDQDGWVVDQGARDCHSLLLAAGEFVRVMVHPFLQTHQFKRAFGFLFAFMGAQSGIAEWQEYIVECAGAREQVELLENKTNFMIAYF